MPKRVSLPDGGIGEFPDDMDDSAIENVLRKQYSPSSSDFDAQVQEAKQEANPITAFIRGNIAGMGLNAQNLNTQRQPNPFGSPIPSMKAVYQAERETSPSAYGMGEVTGSFLSPIKIGNYFRAIPKLPGVMKDKGMRIIDKAIVPGIEGAVNAYNTAEDNKGQAALTGFVTGAGLGVLGDKVSKSLAPKINKAKDIFGEWADKAYARGVGYLDRSQEQGMKLLQDPKRLSAIRKVGEMEGISPWSRATTKFGKIDDAVEKWSQKAEGVYQRAAELEKLTGKRYGIDPTELLSRNEDRLIQQKYLIPQKVYDETGAEIQTRFLPSDTHADDLAATFGTGGNDLRKNIPTVRKTVGEEVIEEPLKGNLPIETSGALLRSLQKKAKYDKVVTGNRNTLSKMQAGIFRELEEDTLSKQSEPVLQELLSSKKTLNPLLTLRDLAEADLSREANKKVAGLLTPMEAIGLMGGGYAVGDGEGALATPLALIAARRYGFPALYSTNKGLEKFSSKMSPLLEKVTAPGVEQALNPLRYYLTNKREK